MNEYVLTKMKNKLQTRLNFTILMSDGFFFLPDLLLQNELLSVGEKGRKEVDNNDEDEVNKNDRKW